MDYYVFEINNKSYNCKVSMRTLGRLEKNLSMPFFDFITQMENHLPYLDDVVAIIAESIRTYEPSFTDEELWEDIEATYGSNIADGFQGLYTALMEILKTSGFTDNKKKGGRKSTKNS